MQPTRGLQARYARRGPIPQEVIEATEFTPPPLAADQALIEVLASPINPSDLLALTGDYGSLPRLPAGRSVEGRTFILC